MNTEVADKVVVTGAAQGSAALAVEPMSATKTRCGSKAAVNILANVVHRELAGDGIRTVALAPGLTHTPGMREIVGDAQIERGAANYPGGRIGQPEDLVPLTAFRCGDAANHRSGAVLTVRPPITR
ncbi:SDR family oxidoreductase [Amycolatopsis minnesotensis]|uniref:Uncharacterized protein n=1 Tax=Amycolatopsis minnesotensis TaxID=337894 RepID=A0ABP5DBQ7_9PSEU